MRQCSVCREALPAGEAFLNLAGESVCRRCHYAEQTALQDQRTLEANKNRLGLYGTVKLYKQLFVGAVLVLVGALMLPGLIEARAWQFASVAAGLVALGVAVLAISIKEARSPKE